MCDKIEIGRGRRHSGSSVRAVPLFVFELGRAGRREAGEFIFILCPQVGGDGLRGVPTYLLLLLRALGLFV